MKVGSDVSLNHAGIGPVIDSCLKWNPKSRKTAIELLSDPYFQDCPAACQSLLNVDISLFKDSSNTIKTTPPKEQYQKQDFGERFNTKFEKTQLAVYQSPNLKSKGLMRSFPIPADSDYSTQNDFSQTSPLQSILKRQKYNHPPRTASLNHSSVQTLANKTTGSISDDSISVHPNRRFYPLSYFSSSVGGISNSRASRVFGKPGTSSSFTSSSMKNGSSRIPHVINLNIDSEFELDQYYNYKTVLKSDDTRMCNTGDEENSLISNSFERVDGKIEFEDNARVSLSSLDRTLEQVDNIIQSFASTSPHISKVSKNDGGSNFERGIPSSDPAATVVAAVQRAEAAQESRKYEVALNRLNLHLSSR